MVQRQDGWTLARQRGFLQALADYGSVQKAAASVGMSASGAYRFRARAPDSFAEAWNEALDVSLGTLIDSAMERAIHGTINPVFYKGEVVGERVTHDAKLTMFMLRVRAPAIYANSPVEPPQLPTHADARRQLEEKLDRLRERMISMGDMVP